MEDVEAQTTCFTTKLPCLKFCIAATLSVASFAIGATMIIVLPSTNALIPFYSSLITGALAVWVEAPKWGG